MGSSVNSGSSKMYKAISAESSPCYEGEVCAALTSHITLTSWFSLRPKEMDLLVCPEMFLTGYMFTSPADIKPFLEPPRIGRTSLFCRELATRYQCWVVGGYPELATDEGEGGEQGKPGYNSAVLVSPTGEVVGNYRKSFLYDTDKTWAREGESSLVGA